MIAEPVLEVERLSKSFRALLVTQDVNLTLAAGARHALIGPNGAGKTTLINQISGVLRPSSGFIRLFGLDVTRFSPERRVRLGLARTFQINSLFPSLTVAQTIALAIIARRRQDPVFWRRPSIAAGVVEDVIDTLDMLGLARLADRTVGALGYGQRRLIEIALAMALQPKVLVLDEPAAGLARRDIALLMAVLERMPSELAVLIVEHDMDLVFRFAQEITVLMGGRVLVHGSVEAVRADQRVRDVYLGRRQHG